MDMENESQQIQQQQHIHTPAIVNSGHLLNSGMGLQGLQGLVDNIQTYVTENPFVAIMLGAGLLVMASQVLTNPPKKVVANGR